MLSRCGEPFFTEKFFLFFFCCRKRKVLYMEKETLCKGLMRLSTERIEKNIKDMKIQRNHQSMEKKSVVNY